MTQKGTYLVIAKLECQKEGVKRAVRTLATRLTKTALERATAGPNVSTALVDGPWLKESHDVSPDQLW